MLEKVKETIEQYSLIGKKDRLVVAVSGGIDSVVLLDVLFELKEEYLLELVVAHLNHGFRGREAREDAIFVGKLAASYGLPYESQEISVPDYIDVSGLSPQAAARDIRYRFLEEVRLKHRANAIAVGQNADDQAETVLINLFRGGAATGLKGIPVKRGRIIRPLLDVSRGEIESYGEKKSLQFRFDSSNAKTVYLRNKIRLQLLPLLKKEYNPMIVTSLVKTATIMAEEDKLMAELAELALDKLVTGQNSREITIKLDDFTQLQLAIKRRLVRLICAKLKQNLESNNAESNISFDHVEQVIKLAEHGQTGARINLPQQLIATKSYEQILFSIGKVEAIELGLTAVEVTIPGEVQVPECGLKVVAKLLAEPVFEDYENKNKHFPHEINLDWGKIKGKRLFIRGRRHGDRFMPAGMKGATKKLKDFFIDLKIPREERSRIPLLVTEDDQIIWVIGHRLGEGYVANNDSTKVVQIAAIWNSE
ncbi:MAG: tRNA lysidine(34) synthetase TilS [Bacillota bacterium]|nr:tRNA lysidine(34) synthetase TilS [Bacillota bacterium]